MSRITILIISLALLVVIGSRFIELPTKDTDDLTTTKEPLPTGVVATQNNPTPTVFTQSNSSVWSGRFEGAARGHEGDGSVQVIEDNNQQTLRLEDDFEVTSGPDLYLYFGKDGEYDPTAEIGRLQAPNGSQTYEIPADISVENYNEVWVWCKAFSVPFAKASLSPV